MTKPEISTPDPEELTPAQQEALRRGVSVLSPEKPEEARVGKGKRVAGGVPAVLSSMKHSLHEMGAVRGTKMLLQVNQRHGFDCPGCAWPDPDDKRALTEFCENGAKAVAEEATMRRVEPDFFARYSVGELSQQSDYWLGKQGRLTHPMLLRRGSDHYEPINWEQAFALIGTELNALASPDEGVFYTSGRTSNEAAFLYQLFVRLYGTNNLPDCSNMCHESSGVALGETLGVGKGTVSLADFEVADAIFVIGQNPGTNHPRMLTALQKAVRGGCKIVTINPLPETGLIAFQHPQEPIEVLRGQSTPLTSLFLPVRVGGDVALLKGIMKAMLEAEDADPGTVLDHAFLARHTSGFAAFADDLRCENWDVIVEASGVERDQIEAAAQIAMQSQRTIACWAMGLTQHKNGVANIQEVVNLLLLRGMLGRPGAGVCPVRGHSNVQGDRTMGIWEKMPDAWLDRLGAEFHFAPPRTHGLDTVDAIRAMRDGRARVFVGMGGNFLSATPDTTVTARALQNCRLTVQISTKLNRGHLVTGEQALILPCLGRTERDRQAGGEQWVTVEDSMSMVHASHGTLPPASDLLRSEPAIVAGMAKATLKNHPANREEEGNGLDWDALIADYDRIRDHIARVVPGFDDFNRRVRQDEGFPLPNAAAHLEFHTASGKAQFTTHPIPHRELEPGEFVLMTLRSHDQYNTTIYGLDDRYRGIENARRVIFLHAADIVEAGLQNGQRVDIVGHYEGVERVAPGFQIVTYPIPRRCAAAYYPETNVLVPLDSVADKSNTPTSKFIVVTLRPTQAKPPQSS